MTTITPPSTPIPPDATTIDDWERQHDGRDARGWSGVETECAGGEAWVTGRQHADGQVERWVTVVDRHCNDDDVSPAEARELAAAIREWADLIDQAADQCTAV